MHLKSGSEPNAPEWVLGLGGRFIATFEYSDELPVKGGKKENGLRIGVNLGVLGSTVSKNIQRRPNQLHSSNALGQHAPLGIKSYNEIKSSRVQITGGQR